MRRRSSLMTVKMTNIVASRESRGFWQEAVCAGAGDDYQMLKMYALNEHFFWYRTGEALRG